MNSFGCSFSLSTHVHFFYLILSSLWLITRLHLYRRLSLWWLLKFSFFKLPRFFFNLSPNSNLFKFSRLFFFFSPSNQHAWLGKRTGAGTKKSPPLNQRVHMNTPDAKDGNYGTGMASWEMNYVLGWRARKNPLGHYVTGWVYSINLLC